ncbi:hypothetical protein AB0N89_30765 [Amycolatopsis sp. NPDC089917]|uniref:hypothetical protein n=1 Tax=Amycolatopsis sp. NPDC089917 TaxID=3155187 RepID=UPI00343B31AD
MKRLATRAFGDKSFKESDVDGFSEQEAADIVAGAIKAGKDGRLGYRRLIEDRVYEIAVETEC